MVATRKTLPVVFVAGDGSSFGTAEEAKKYSKDKKQMATKMTTNSLGNAQTNLEQAAQKLKVAQKAFTKAEGDLQSAEENHATAWQTLNAEVKALQEATRVSPLGAK